MRDFGVHWLRLCLVPFVALLPEATGDDEGIDIALPPPPAFVACGVDVVMVDGAKRHGELIANLETQPFGLRVTYVVRVRRHPPADEGKAGWRRSGDAPRSGSRLWLVDS